MITHPLPGRFVYFEPNGVMLRARIAGDGPPVIFVHGFPESWYSWRHQIGPVAQAGFTAVAIDVRGYGDSAKPFAVEDYDMESLTGDVAGLVDALGRGPAILVGHDWGAPIVWNTALVHDDRIRAVAGLSVPYTGVPSAPFIDVVREIFTKNGRFFYQVYFQDEGLAEAELETDVEASLRKFYYAISGDAPEGAWPADKPHGAGLLDRLPDPDPFPAWLTAEDLAYYTGEFRRSGFRGPLNRYRNHERDFAWLQSFRERTIDQPSLFIGGTKDLVLKMIPGSDMVAAMAPHLSDLRGATLLEGCGHWTQQERPEEVTRLLLSWLDGL
ncbi:MAG: alpha/beta fold hydrolase [Alphaproteobacteria bacterium]